MLHYLVDTDSGHSDGELQETTLTRHDNMETQTDN